LNEVQEGVLTIAFHVADKDGLLMLDLDDLQAMLVHCGERADELTLEYGNISKQSVGSIQRSVLLQLRSQGGEHFFGEPALDLLDFHQSSTTVRPGYRQHPCGRQADGQPEALLDLPAYGCCPNCSKTSPKWAIADKPKMVFFFDEAHLLFNDAPKALLEKIEQVVRLIRSKGIGVYFITQNPIDIPDTVAAQLNNRIQHKLNAFTPRDQQAVKVGCGNLPPQSRHRRRSGHYRTENRGSARVLAATRRFAVHRAKDIDQGTRKPRWSVNAAGTRRHDPDRRDRR
jgi:DNA helicase HerA-like ATPase